MREGQIRIGLQGLVEFPLGSQPIPIKKQFDRCKRGMRLRQRVIEFDGPQGCGLDILLTVDSSGLALISIEAVSTPPEMQVFLEGHGRLRRYPPRRVFLLLDFHIRLHEEDAAYGL